MKTNWKLIWLLTFLGVVGIFSIIPYQLNVIMGDLLSEIEGEIPLSIALLLGAIQQSIMLWIMVLIGVKLLPTTKLDVPHLRAWTERAPVPHISGKWIGIGILGSLIGSLITIMLEVFVFGPRIATIDDVNHAEWWQGLLAMFYGGITEELMLRLFVMTLFVWIFVKVFNRNKTIISPIYYWIAIVIASLLFGLLHLPATVTAFGELTGLLVIRAFLLNGILGIWFGYLYWKKGLEYAIISHMAADLFLHVILIRLFT